jgi:hypothetical protein
MSSYAVLWQDQLGRTRAGRLEFDPHGLWLHGGDRNDETRLEIPYGEIVVAEREPRRRIGPCRALRLECRNAGPLLLASLGSGGILAEILERIQQAGMS